MAATLDKLTRYEVHLDRKPAKDKSTERIDGIVALIMALGRAILPEEPAPEYQFFILGR